MLYLNFEAQGHGSAFTFYQAHLEKAIFLHKMARVRFDLNTAVFTIKTRQENFPEKTALKRNPC